IIVRVLHHSKTVFEWEGLPVNENTNVEDFFNDVVVRAPNGSGRVGYPNFGSKFGALVVVNELKTELWEKNCIAYFSLTETSEMEKIGLKCNAWETVKPCGKYVTFKLLDDPNNE